ncbi:kinase-like domain-containing protein [Catenaria anguillulae PL171]|uniref:non-specific serine/threonine protein kinase n=1 Tax=Catenaria anguillulae PL171 TaxID=765915 RepID=A0A1Y2HCZ8_9FUNG|nr:kinase-like domain-containing protein [Catenaria anguillulae PL171]
MASIKARIGAYEVIETLGAGSFGKVKLALHTLTNHKVALKFINKAKLAREHGMPQRVAREIDYLRFLRHPHIIKLYEVLHTPQDLVMVMEYAGDELFHYISDRGRMAEHEARRFLQQLVSAVEYCHRHRIVHRDLKPENLLLDSQKNLKVADFGLSNSLRDGDFLKTSCGSPNYAAPEVILGKLYAGPEVDVWSIGVILYVMLVGRLPFEDEYIPALFQKISSGQYAIPAFMSPDARSLVQAMLIVDPLKRITLAEVRSHPFFTKDLPAYLSPLPPIPYSTIGLVHHHTHASSSHDVAAAAAADDPNAAEDSVPLDDSIVDELASKLHLSRDEILARLLDDPPPADSNDASQPNAHANDDANDPVRVAYMLCADNRHLWSGNRSANAFKDVHWMSGTPPSGATGTTAPAALAAQPASTTAARRQWPHRLLLLPHRHLPAQPAQTGPAPAPAPPRKARSKWHVGIRSRSPPIDVMLELYKALAAVGMEWKPLGPFALRARYEFDTHDDNGTGRRAQDDDEDQDEQVEKKAKDKVIVKLDVQLYKVDTAYFLVDFKLQARVWQTRQGPGRQCGGDRAWSAGAEVVSPYAFLDVAVRIITELASG